ncbi:hypothetical protein HMPREF1625_00635 [Staphylococcus aureus 880]|nr:hypothetical protein HMPREF1625_00635 [Staphylococcus aureus 880]
MIQRFSSIKFFTILKMNARNLKFQLEIILIKDINHLFLY